MKLEKIKDSFGLVYQVIQELLKFVDFLETENVDIPAVTEKLPVVKRGLLVVEKVLNGIAKIFKIDIDVVQTAGLFNENQLNALVNEFEKNEIE